MQIRLGYELVFESAQATPMILMLNMHPSRLHDVIRQDFMATFPRVPVHTYHDSYGNLCTRLVAPSGTFRISADGLVADSGLPEPVVPNAPATPVEQLPDAALVYLLASRYCDSDNLSDFAWSHFGHTSPGWGRVQAICDFVHDRLQFGYQFARPTRTASEALNEGRGVCRDFAHLAITLCRCMNIPARYCSGYLGDIGVPPVDLPMDFSGWFEAYLGGNWYTFDARHNEPRIGRVLIARGRDAADAAISTSFGQTQLQSFRVWTDEGDPPGASS
jgi:transglutaminase-like putative cysteine protease